MCLSDESLFMYFFVTLLYYHNTQNNCVSYQNNTYWLLFVYHIRLVSTSISDVVASSTTIYAVIFEGSKFCCNQST